MRTEYIFNLKEKTIPETIGSKAANLRFLVEQKYPIPETFVCTWDAHKHYFNPIEEPINDILKVELLQKLDLTKQYAIRSSANIEDGSNYSCAGQFKSILNVSGIDNILNAIESIWSSTHSEGVKTYLKRIGEDQQELKMAVIIQEMIEPAVSGVTFSRNPLTGMDEIIVEATIGHGENLVQNGITPDRWVNKWGEWTVKPKLSPIATPLIQEVVSDTKKIAQTYGNDVDVEWVYDGNTINWVQLREITSLKNTTFYSNHFAKEVFPGMIKPLIWSINVPLICSAWIRLFDQLVGRCNFEPHSLAKPFYYRAYFNMGTIAEIFKQLGLPSNTIELLMNVESQGSEKPSFKPGTKTLLLLPRLVLFAINLFMFPRKINNFLPQMKRRYSSFAATTIDSLNPEELILQIDKLYKLNEEAAYYMILTYLLMGLYNGLLKNQLNKYGISFENIDFTSDIDGLNDFNPTVTLNTLNKAFKQFPTPLQEKIKQSSYADFVTIDGIDSFHESLKIFIQHFGHLSDSGNDFSSTPWRETPESIITMIANYAQRRETAGSKAHFKKLPMPGFPRIFLTPLYRKARDFRYFREAVSFLYTFGYGMFRPYFLSLGDYFCRKGLFEDKTDIFYLTFPEIKELVRNESRGAHYKDAIGTRKCEMKELKNITLPHIIYGDDQPPISVRTGNKLTGIPTSKGMYAGTVKVVRGINDFNKLSDGDILVIPFSDVAWTPLFSKAGAIVAESGGFLSHSSIIAREYEIPAVVSVQEACQIEDGTTVTVDGYSGEIIIHSKN
jgi:pyruvate,water dikinase